jgi:tetratricopeptide (TPR) repeat protein/predicted Ser/Thr protein kinase
MVEELVRQARPEQGDAVATVLRARVRRALVGADVPRPTIGRFTVLDRVGAGAVGTVYAAYDPVLDRRVAIKVLARAATHRDDLLAEARALAKLRHPNVVAVHEAGHAGDESYIAMEFVEGQTLREWLDAGDRSPAEIEDALVAAGRGLAAAHAAGIAHGDFKPHNVLVGRDGVRVADFGMARLATADASNERGHGGTPAYMAPERLDGAPPSPAADQFAFAVTVFEAATGRRPFEASSIATLREAMQQPLGVPRVAAPRVRWLAAARRGLSPSPGDRFASVEAMLATLQPRRSGVTANVAAFMAISIAAAAVIVTYRSTPDDPCAGGAIAISTSWNDARAATVRAAITQASPAPLGEAVAERVEARLDTYREAWIDVHRRVCEATRVSATQSDSLHDLRMRCLERRRVELGEVVGVLGEVERAREVAEALEAADGLRPVMDCEAAEAADSELALPAEAGDREAVERVRQDLDRAWALFRVARYPDAARIADASLATAEALAFEPLIAESLLLVGTVKGRIDALDTAEPILRRARVAAARVANDRLASDTSMQLLRSVMFGNDPQRVEDLADFARADAIRAGADPNEVDGIVGEAWMHAGDPARAIEAIDKALSTEQRPPRIALLQSNAGSARLAAGDIAAAVQWYRRALDTATAHFGAGHPAIGFHLQRFGRGQLAAGQADEALRSLAEALRLREAALGPDDRAVASSLADLARAEATLERHDDARAHLLRALEIRTMQFGADDPRLAVVLLQLGDVELQTGDATSALEHYARARSLRESSEAIHPELVEALRGEATALHALGRLDEAAASRTRSETLAARLPAGHRLARPAP